MEVRGKYFYGNEVSQYGQENGYVDYGTLAKAFDAVLNNDIMQKTADIGWWEQESGFIDHSDEIDEIREQIEELEQFEGTDEEVEEKEEEIIDLEARIEELEHEQDPSEIFQYYIVDDGGAELLKEINEIVFYNEELDMYVWGVTHLGTSWDYVLTDIRCNTGDDAAKKFCPEVNERLL